MSLADVLGFDAAAHRDTMRAWESAAARFDRATADLIRSARLLDDTWPAGIAAEAARERNGRLVRETDLAYNPARRIVEALDAYTASMSALRVELESLRAASAPTWPGNPTTGPAPGRQVPAPPERTPPDLDALVIDSILARAQAADDRYAAVLRANLPDPGLGFVPLAEPPVPRGRVAAMAGLPPAEVAAWWAGLTPVQRERVLADDPDLVGALDGVPAVDRDRANRANLDALAGNLDQRARQLQEQIVGFRAAHPGSPTVGHAELYQLQAELAQARSSLAGLDQIRAQLARFGRDAFLLGVDAAGDGRAIIALGDPDTARHTAVWVPGVGTDLGDTAGNMDRVSNLRLAADPLTAQPGDVCAIMWFGYDTPGVIDPGALLPGKAQAGARELDAFVDGLNATHDRDTSHVTVIGHSYGTAVIGEAARAGDGLAVQDVVAVGSPGMDTDRASDLRLDPRHVWAGATPDDPIAALGEIPFVHSEEPTDPSFGANEFTVDTHGHSAYWSAGSQSLANQARIVVGVYQDVTLVHGQAPTG